MHNNYYFIRQLVKELSSSLSGFKVVDAYSQNKDEAIFRLQKSGQELNVVAHLTGQFTCLAFPKEYSKARKNTATIFPNLIGKEIRKAQGYENERAFSILFDDKKLLVFKLFGRQSNLILFDNNEVIELFKKGYSSDLELIEQNLHRPLDQSYSAILRSLPNYRSVYPTLHKSMIGNIDRNIADLSSDASAQKIIDLVDLYKNPVGYKITASKGLPVLEIDIANESPDNFHSACEAITKFFFLYQKSHRLQLQRSRLLKEIDRKAGKTKVYLSKVKRKVNTIQNETNYKSMADLLMANLYNIPNNSKKVSLPDFYDEDNLIEIKLNPQLSIQQNAERYYKKAKNVNLEIQNLHNSIKVKEKLLSELELSRVDIENATDYKSLKGHMKSEVIKDKGKETPFKEFNIGGYVVYVGNNAKQNDLLTLKYAKKEDLFFHAKDVSGSHVILKDKAGTNVPARVLEETASIAAYFSKRKTDTLCPVGYTKKKYVRKPKGAVPGLVLVDREKVLLVPPKLPESTQQH